MAEGKMHFAPVMALDTGDFVVIGDKVVEVDNTPREDVDGAFLSVHGTTFSHRADVWKRVSARFSTNAMIPRLDDDFNLDAYTIDDVKTYLTVLEGASLQFRDGDLISTEWPDKDLIYVDKALRKAATKRDGIYEKDEVHGLFARRYDSDGDCYYAPVEADDQGIDKNWMLMEHYDIILGWRPVNIAAVLKEAI